MLFTERGFVYSESGVDHTTTLCGRNAKMQTFLML